MNELELSGRNKKINIAAWSLAIFVIVVGVIMMVTTGEKIFLLFIILGLLTVVNVIFYDRVVLKPKLAKLRADREAAETNQEKTL
ncbi:hypothetical protein CLV47_102141 [Antricoccus suffuscus]|uniref:Uncharacterized protein n=1 Tax=Antricoccus suffuscus TaxID=1629062 RepID=A0A2T1A4C9_9ACTN|nr:hypothetical protein [Antricoccus suffuscus]PRZ43455.1 hypothetical protein CLV47_102141 [Antricoccus suffuscus]